MKKRANTKTRQLLDKAEKAERFPYCAGSFDTCPAKKIDPHCPPKGCIKCPIYTESRYYKAPKPVLDDFAKMIFSKEK